MRQPPAQRSTDGGFLGIDRPLIIAPGDVSRPVGGAASLRREEFLHRVGHADQHHAEMQQRGHQRQARGFLTPVQAARGHEHAGGLAFAQRFPITELGSQLDVTGGAFLDTAAVLLNLDLVITCDTALVHLAGGLGVPVWLGLSLAHHWPWLLEREDSPWYPSLCLFRQTERGNWPGVFQRMAEALQQRLAQATPLPRPVSDAGGQALAPRGAVAPA